MHQGEQSSWVRTARKRRPARGRANDDVWHPGSSAVRPFAGSAFVGGSWPVARGGRGDLHPTVTASPVTKGARRCSRRGSIRRRVEFLFSVPSARANERSSQGGRHERGSHSRGTGVAQAPFAPHRQRCSTRTQCPASAPAFRCSSQDEWRLCRAPARQGWARITLFVESVPTFEVSVEVERRRRSRNVQRRGKPERCIDRIAEGAETPEANRRRAQDRGGQAARSGPPTACADPQG